MMHAVLSFNYILYLLVPAAFLLGSIPFGIIFTRSSGVDIRSTGSKNIGATNVLRSAGKIPAVLTLLCDLLKGSAAVLICKIIILKTSIPPDTFDRAGAIEEIWLGIIGLTAVLGHMYSVFLSFRGGKGVATGFGVLLVYSPPVAGITLLIWILVAVTFKYSSLAAIAALGTMPLVFAAFKASVIELVFAGLLAALILYKHKSNISNLMKGKENKIGGN